MTIFETIFNMIGLEWGLSVVDVLGGLAERSGHSQPEI